MRVNFEESDKAFEKEAPASGKNGKSPLVRRREFLSGVLSAILAADVARPSAALCNDPPEPGKHGAAAELAGRVLGAHAESIIFESIPAAGGLDVFEIETRGDCLILRGNNPVAQARALNHYLREYCGAHISWTGDQLNLPARWPQVTGKVQKGSPYRYHCYLDKDRLEQNARTLVTVWGAELPAQSLHDYSNREWSGLLRSFYYERWKRWVDAHTAALGGTSPEPVAWFKWEEAWTRERKTFPAAPAGDSVTEARRIAETYSALLQRSLETT